MPRINGQSLLTAFFVGSSRLSPAAFASSATQGVRLRALGGFSDGLRSLGRSLDRLAELAALTPRRGSSVAASVGSRSDLELSSPASLRSSEEVNTVATSFTPFGPAVSGSSTTLPTIGGTYDGAQGDDTLTFEFRHTRTVGSGGRLRVQVRDGQGDTIETLRFDSAAPDQPIALSNGLTLSLSAGSAVKKDTFQVAVSTSQGSAVDPSQPFDGTRNQNPNLEPGHSVGAGSFEVNGVAIAVSANDTLTSVLARITSSAAGVTATFDVASERVVLTDAGSAGTITVGNDTSGFLSATKLDTATVVPGGSGSASQPLQTAPRFSAVQAGSISLNGVAIAVDPAVDSLADVLDRINLSAAGVTARLDSRGNRVHLESRDPRAPLDVSDGGTGLLAALEITAGRFEARVQERGGSFELAEAPAIRNELRELGRGLRNLFGNGYSGLARDELASFRSELSAAVRSAFESTLDRSSAGRVLRSGFGIDFDLGAPAGRVVEVDEERLARALRSDAERLSAFLFADGKGSASGAGGETTRGTGLVHSLLGALDTLQQRVEVKLGVAEGRRVDLRV